jgi:hypothetical protein
MPKDSTIGTLRALSYELKHHAELIKYADNTAGLTGQYRLALKYESQSRAVDRALEIVEGGVND